MTREHKRAAFMELAANDGITTGRQFALEYTAPDQETKRKPIVGPARLLIEHPFKDDRAWMVAKKLPEPQFYLLCTPVPTTLLMEIYTLDVYESRNQRGV